jgi:hypothetical protein
MVSGLAAGGYLLHGPAVPVRIAEEDEPDVVEGVPVTARPRRVPVPAVPLGSPFRAGVPAPRCSTHRTEGPNENSSAAKTVGRMVWRHLAGWRGPPGEHAAQASL